MSPPTRKPRAHRRAAPIFAALGDQTRLDLVDRLAAGSPRSISDLAQGAAISRQAITKHLRVLKNAGLVRSSRRGRETRFQLAPEALAEARARLDAISRQWDAALARLETFLEQNPR